MGSLLVRQMLDEFEVAKHDTRFQCIIHEPMSENLKTLRMAFPTKSLPTVILKATLY